MSAGPIITADATLSGLARRAPADLERVDLDADLAAARGDDLEADPTGALPGASLLGVLRRNASTGALRRRGVTGAMPGAAVLTRADLARRADAA